jgi:hypothetical protein
MGDFSQDTVAVISPLFMVALSEVGTESVNDDVQSAWIDVWLLVLNKAIFDEFFYRIYLHD